MGKPATRRPPGPRGRRLVGNSYDYDQDRVGFLRRCQAEYGDVFSFSSSTVVICDPELIHDVLSRSNEDFLAEAPVFVDAAESAHLERNVDGWMRSRQVGWRGMTRAVAKTHGERILTAFDGVLRATAGREFDVVAAMRDYSSHMVADLLFGPGSEKIVDKANYRSELAVRFMSSNLSVPKWLPLPGVRRAIRAEDDSRAEIAAQVRRRRAEPHAQASDMLDLLLDDTDTALTDEQVAGVLGSSLLASFGSPGGALSWAIQEISANDEVQRRLRAEAVKVLGETGSLTDDARLPYTRAFVKEVLRLYPPVWLMGRLVRRPCALAGWPLSVGQYVMFSPYLLHRDPRWWADPGEMKPDRWLGGTAPGSRRAYIPFGAGPRMCLGLHLGLYQLAIATAHLAAHYRVELPDGPPARLDLSAILLPQGLRARITPLALASTPSSEVAAEVAN